MRRPFLLPLLALGAVCASAAPRQKPESAPAAQGDPPVNSGIELQNLLLSIRRGVPAGTGPEAEAARRAHYLASREALEAFASKCEGTLEAEAARTSGATLALAAGEAAIAAAALEGVLGRLEGQDEARAASVFTDALSWYCEAAPEKAKRKLESLEAAGGPFATVAASLHARAVAAARAQVGKPCAPFHATAVDGTPVDARIAEGKVFILHFWSSALPESMRQLDALKKLYKRHHARGLEIVGVCLDSANVRSVPGRGEPLGAGPAAVRAFCEQYGIPWRQVAEGKGTEAALSSTFNVRAAPAILVADRGGTWRHIRSDLTPIEDDLERLLDGR